MAQQHRIKVSNPYRLSVNIKSGLFILAVLIILGVIAYTQYILERLRDDSRHIVKIYAQLIARIGQEDPEAEYSFVFDEVIKRIDFPIVNTDADGNPLSWRNIVEVESEAPTQENIDKIKAIIQRMDEENEPLPIRFENTVLGYIHYDTDSKLIRELRWLPFIEIAVVGSFILIGYIGFSNIKRSEQRSIWIGMAKETAHQLGTPLSSLMGWVELLRQETDGRENATKILNEFDIDLKRMDKVVARFSQIGSASDLKYQDLIPIISDIVQYFRNRVPQLGKKVLLEEDYRTSAMAHCNPQLFGWVIENVIKNALDAIEEKEGKIALTLFTHNGYLCLDIRDNGRGISIKNHENIFRPGYSTKKRGWGLGLSLAKRIIEDYHGGKIFVKESKPGEGTTIRIQLKY
ncbi:HAMP domain-containing histidine kinase [bacterium]|nr:HAMP domain-containing histidine kinase [bacterium]